MLSVHAPCPTAHRSRGCYRSSVKVFISHSSSDKGEAKALAVALKNRGVDVWFDEWELVPGQSWQHEIGRALDASSAMVVLITPESIDSEWVKSEINFALANESFQGRVFPVVVGDEVPDNTPWILRRFQLLHLRSDVSGSVDSSADAIAQSLGVAARVRTS